MRLNDALRLAILDMVKNGEFDRLIKNTHGKERRHIKELKKVFSMYDIERLNRVSIVLIITCINSAVVWQSIYFYMMNVESEG